MRETETFEYIRRKYPDKEETWRKVTRLVKFDENLEVKSVHDFNMECYISSFGRLIPDWIGVYIGDYCAKKAKKQDLSGREYKMRRSVNGRSTEVSTPWVDMLKESMIRSLYRDSDKLIQTEDEQYISRLRSQIDKARTERDRESKKYLRLWKAVRKEFGDEKAWELIEKAEE